MPSSTSQELKAAKDAPAAARADSGAMAIIVLRELRKETSKDFGPGNPIDHPKAVHAAPADPDDQTFCGKPTADMERVNYEPSGPGAPWLPPNMREWKCNTGGCAGGCARVLTASVMPPA